MSLLSHLLYRLPPWIRGHQLAIIPDPGDVKEDDYAGAHVRTEDIAKAHVILSLERGTGLHRPVLDIDFPVHVERSSTEGHYHLYLDKVMDWDRYTKFLSALVEAEIIERQYASVSEARGYTSVRLPWIRKDKK